ncbi:MAG: hypothetical protein DWQ08_06275 [Proteobacteria bacterium]|nr:MAG: hypothetical protein DWQ08_06275 [Pseudomonadota bacterium]
MFRILRKRYLLRFKGIGILSQTTFVAVMLGLVNALAAYRSLSVEPVLALADTVPAALAVAAVSYLPLRLFYRSIQRQPLISALVLSLLIAGAAAYLFAMGIGSYYRGPIFTTLPWPPDNPSSASLEIALMTLFGYALVIQYAVSTRRERMARRRNTSNRLKALQARIRPHFFFNTLNSVASLIRTDPESAEKAIEDLADIFRVVIRADRKLVSLADEVEIARQYMNIEQLRLGDRLVVEWHISPEAQNATIPSLTLQPLLENAVYHGIEPSMSGGVITIDCSCEDDRLHILVTNPVPELRPAREQGNNVALKNIRERLRRQFDGDVKINIRNTRERFNVSIDAPLQHARRAKS